MPGEALSPAQPPAGSMAETTESGCTCDANALMLKPCPTKLPSRNKTSRSMSTPKTHCKTQQLWQQTPPARRPPALHVRGAADSAPHAHVGRGCFKCSCCRDSDSFPGNADSAAMSSCSRVAESFAADAIPLPPVVRMVQCLPHRSTETQSPNSVRLRRAQIHRHRRPFDGARRRAACRGRALHVPARQYLRPGNQAGTV